jgi:hypothetical protein
MTATLPTAAQTARAAEVKALLRDIGYALWLSKRVEAEVVAATRPPVRAMAPVPGATKPLAYAA